jgi:hypothetical protein
MKSICVAALGAALVVASGCSPTPGTNLPTRGQAPPPPGAMDKSTYKPGQDDKAGKGGKMIPPAGK